GRRTGKPIAFFETGKRKPSLKLIADIADTLGFDRQQLLFLAHPEAKGFILKSNSGNQRKKTTPSWRQFIGNRELLTRYHVNDRELRALEQFSLLKAIRSPKQYLAILMLVRDIPKIKQSK